MLPNYHRKTLRKWKNWEKKDIRGLEHSNEAECKAEQVVYYFRWSGTFYKCTSSDPDIC